MTTRRGAVARPRFTRALLLAHAREALERADVPSPEHDAEAILRHALAVSRAEFWSNPKAAVGDEEAARFSRLLEARARRVPLQHLLGDVPFHAAALHAEPGVFIPRPETEFLVERVLGELGAERGSHPPSGTLLDLGTGTGAIAIALLLALPRGWSASALDVSERACALAARNARRNGVFERMRIVRGDLRDPRACGLAPADMLASNLPYIPTGAIAGLMPEVRDHDPREALDGGPDGLDAFRAVAGAMSAWVKPGGLVALEIGDEQADTSLELFGPHLAGARVERDLAGMPRVLIGRTRGT